MDKNETKLTIGELARTAGVSIRTIRFYIQEGLLPQPEVRGKYTWYDGSYLLRLRLIQHLKESFLPLKEIRSRLVHLTDDQVRGVLESAGKDASTVSVQTDHVSSLPPMPPASAVDYLKEVIQPVRSGPLQMGKITEAHDLYAPPRQPGLEGETWQRITLAPGIELHIKHPLPAASQAQLRHLISFARALFEKHTSHSE